VTLPRQQCGAVTLVRSSSQDAEVADSLVRQLETLYEHGALVDY
jgi:hypothetical protein